jgi:hypothetical protein
METGLPDKDMFNIVVEYLERYKEWVVYFALWRVEMLSFEDQVFMVLMKLRHSYTNLHLAQLFHCCASTVSNVTITFINITKTVPSRERNMLVCDFSGVQKKLQDGH